MSWWAYRVSWVNPDGTAKGKAGRFRVDLGGNPYRILVKSRPELGLDSKKLDGKLVHVAIRPSLRSIDVVVQTA